MAVMQVIVNVVDFDMTMAEAVAAPRFSATSDIVDVSNRIPRFVTAELEEQGYPVARSYLSYAFAGVHAIKSNRECWSGGPDPGRDGMALEVWQDSTLPRHDHDAPRHRERNPDDPAD